MTELIEIFSRFVDTKAKLIEPFGSGNINDTYRVFINNDTEPKYILQRINKSVFTDVEALSGNIRKITEHIEQQLNGDTTYRLMKPVTSKYGIDWIDGNNGSAWRVFNYIADSISIDIIEFPNQAYEAGKAFGWFLNNLSSFDTNKLVSVIPNFHNLSHRIEQLNKAIEENAANRLKNCNDIVDFYLERVDELISFYNLFGSEQVPFRVTHNDTKVNNVLFSSDWRAISVIDLDTVMQGVIHFDYGDSIRTIAATAVEDELDLSQVGVNLSLLKSYTEGFLSQVSNCLTDTERQTLYIAPKLMTYIMGIRFLTDYLCGDTYYKIKHPLHNIQRARNQKALIVDLESKSEKIKQIILNK